MSKIKEDFKTDQEYHDYLMEEAFKEDNRRVVETTRQNTRLLKAIKSIRGDLYFESLTEFLKEIEFGYTLYYDFSLELIEQPIGDQQDSEYELLGQEWVEQYNSYPCEDCYHGTICLEIKPNKYLKIPFSM